MKTFLILFASLSAFGAEPVKPVGEWIVTQKVGSATLTTFTIPVDGITTHVRLKGLCQCVTAKPNKKFLCYVGRIHAESAWQYVAVENMVTRKPVKSEKVEVTCAE